MQGCLYFAPQTIILATKQTVVGGRFKGLTTLLALGLVQNFDIINLHRAVDTLEVRNKMHSFAKLCRNLSNSRFLFNLARITPFYTYSFLRKCPFHALCGQGGL